MTNQLIQFILSIVSILASVVGLLLSLLDKKS